MEYIIDSENGKVFNKRGYEIGGLKSNGNVTVNLNGKTHIIPRLIYESVHGAIPEGYVIHHKDGDITNNRISNLEIVPKKRKVQQLSLSGEVIKEYDSISDVVNGGFAMSGVSRCCRGIFRQHGGYIWKFI